MATIYVTEQVRFLDDGAFRIGILRSVRATVSDQPEDFNAVAKDYKPEEWRALLAGPDVMYRYKKEPYQRLSA